MIITTKHDIFENVKISGIDQLARIIKITLNGNNLIYTVEYWHNCEIKCYEAYGNDLQKLQGENSSLKQSAFTDVPKILQEPQK